MNQVVLDGKSHQTKMSSTLLTEVIKEFDDEKFQNEKMQEMHYTVYFCFLFSNHIHNIYFIKTQTLTCFID